MRSTLDLLDFPFTFTQLRPLTAQGFLSSGRDRGVHLNEQMLEALHRTRVLVPFFRFQRENRAIAAIARRDPRRAVQAAHWQPTSRDDLLEARQEGRLHDPAHEHFIARDRLRRPLGEWSYESSVYLYAPHQLIALPLVEDARGALRFEKQGERVVGRLEAHEFSLCRWREVARGQREIVTAVSALEPLYYSRIFHHMRLRDDATFDAFFEWRAALPTEAMSEWLDVDGAWLAEAGGALLRDADFIDPLGDWEEVIAAGEPEKWQRLRGEARRANDLRVAAEFLLRYHDSLVRHGLAEALPEGHPRMAGPFESRLRRRRSLNDLLTEFGLSPHPRLILVVEGATERATFPWAFQLLDVELHDDFIAIEDAEGSDRDLAPLVAFAAAPRIEREVDGRYLRLTRPPTRILVVFDPEGKAATAAQREERRDNWVERLMRTLPPSARTAVVREQINRYLEVVTWTKTGANFEFAHFTDRQLASAISRLDRRRRQPTHDERLRILATLRANGGNLDSLLGPVSKVRLAEELWPTLERRIERALATGTERRIPIVRMVALAVRLAQEFPRNLVIALER